MTWSSRNPDAFGQTLVGGGLLRRPGAGAGSSSAVWSWEVSSRFGYAFTGDWGPVESSWDSLPSSWNPAGFRPDPGSIAALGAEKAGIFDHGVWSGRCEPPENEGTAGDLVDVSLSADLLCTAASVSIPHVGALMPPFSAGVASSLGLLSADSRIAQRAQMNGARGVAFGRLL